MKRILPVLLFSLLVSSTAYASTILVFGQTTGANLVTGTEVGGITTIDANGLPVTITTLNEAASNLAALFSLDAVSTAPATNVSGDLWTQSYSGDFSILSAGGFNYLSGEFDGVQLGIESGNTYIFGSAQPPLSLVFTSDVVGMPLGDPTAMALALTNVFPNVFISNGSFGSFNSNVSGTFSAQAVPEIPEPATLILMGSGLIYLMKRRFDTQI